MTCVFRRQLGNLLADRECHNVQNLALNRFDRISRLAFVRINVVAFPVPRAGGATDCMTLARALEAQRQVLFRAQAVAELIRLHLEEHDFRQHNNADLSVVFGPIDQTLDRTLTALEPLCLGLPIPGLNG